MNEKLIQIDLLGEKTKIQQQIASLKRDLEAIDRLLDKYEKDEEKAVYTDGIIFEIMSASEAVIKLFNDFSSKEWKSKELAENLQKLVKEGKVESNSRDLLTSTRSIIKTLLKNKFIEKVPVMGGMRYKKRI